MQACSWSVWSCKFDYDITISINCLQSFSCRSFLSQLSVWSESIIIILLMFVVVLKINCIDRSMYYEYTLVMNFDYTRTCLIATPTKIVEEEVFEVFSISCVQPSYKVIALKSLTCLWLLSPSTCKLSSCYDCNHGAILKSHIRFCCYGFAVWHLSALTCLSILSWPYLTK